MRIYILAFLYLIVPQAVLAADSFPIPAGWEIVDARQASKDDIAARKKSN